MEQRHGGHVDIAVVNAKAVDAAVGDLALAGAPLIGEYRSYCGGHKMNVAVLAALFADRSAWRFVDATPAPRAAIVEARA